MHSTTLSEVQKWSQTDIGYSGADTNTIVPQLKSTRIAKMYVT